MDIETVNQQATVNNHIRNGVCKDQGHNYTETHLRMGAQSPQIQVYCTRCDYLVLGKSNG